MCAALLMTCTIHAIIQFPIHSFLSSLKELQLQWEGGRGNSSGQTLIFSLSFPPVTTFVGITVLILSLVRWNHKSGCAIRRRGRETPNLNDILEDRAKCSAQGVAFYSLPIWLHTKRGFWPVNKLKIKWNAVHAGAQTHQLKETVAWIYSSFRESYFVFIV